MMLSDGRLAERGERVGDVQAHLRDERLDALVAQGRAQPLDELDDDLLVVQVEVCAPDDVGLDDPLGDVPEGRVRPDGDRGGQPLPRPLVPAQPAGVDAVGGDGAGRGRGEVRRREAEVTPAGLAADDDAAHPVGAAEDGRGRGDVPRLDELARPAGGPASVHPDVLDDVDDEAVLPSQGRHRVLVTGVAAAEARVVPDDDGARPQSVPQVPGDELLGRQSGEVEGVVEDERGVDADLGEEGEPVGETGEERRRRAGPVDLRGVRVEGEGDGGDPEGAGPVGRGREDGPVAAVDAVKVADGDDTAAQTVGDPLDAVPHLHAGAPSVVGGRWLRAAAETTPAQPMRIPAMAADRRLPSVPASTARRPRVAMTLRWVGAMPPSPPRRMAREPRFAKPVSAKVMTAWDFSLKSSALGAKSEKATNSLRMTFWPRKLPASTASWRGTPTAAMIGEKT